VRGSRIVAGGRNGRRNWNHHCGFCDSRRKVVKIFKKAALDEITFEAAQQRPSSADFINPAMAEKFSEISF
jgi:hypothetical protein